MYYEEQWVDGALCWRTSPTGAWTRYTANELAHRYESAEKRAADAQATVEALQKKYDDLLGKYRQLVDFYDKHNGTPCEQIRHQQQVEALQRERDEAASDRDDWITSWRALQRHNERIEAALDAERGKVTGLHEITKVICTHCCEPMEIPSKAVLQTQLTQLQALVRELPKCEGWVSVIQAATDEWHIYDGIFTTEESAHAYAALLTYRATLGENS